MTTVLEHWYRVRDLCEAPRVNLNINRPDRLTPLDAQERSKAFLAKIKYAGKDQQVGPKEIVKHVISGAGRVAADPIVGGIRQIGKTKAFLEKPRLEKELKNLGAVIPKSARHLGSGVEAHGFREIRGQNPDNDKVLRISAGGSVERPKSSRVTQADDVARIGRFTVERTPFRKPIYAGGKIVKTKGGTDQFSARLEHPKGGHAATDIMFHMVGKENLLPMDSHVGNIGTNPKTKQAELFDPGFVHKLSGRQVARAREYLTKNDPTAQDSYDYRVNLARHVGIDREKVVGKAASSGGVSRHFTPSYDDQPRRKVVSNIPALPKGKTVVPAPNPKRYASSFNIRSASRREMSGPSSTSLRRIEMGHGLDLPSAPREKRRFQPLGTSTRGRIQMAFNKAGMEGVKRLKAVNQQLNPVNPRVGPKGLRTESILIEAKQLGPIGRAKKRMREAERTIARAEAKRPKRKISPKDRNYQAPAPDIYFVPENKAEMTKLRDRSVLGHVGHGALRYAAGNAVAGAMSNQLYFLEPEYHPGVAKAHAAIKVTGGVANTLRYARKVRNAKAGLHREQERFLQRRQKVTW